MKKGFTLIELLIVIAIIGILASIVLVSLSSAREKSKVVSFKTGANSVRTKAILACDSLTTLNYAALITAIGTLPPNVSVTQHAGGAALACGAASGSGIFDLDITTTTTNCSGRATINGIVFSGTASSC